MTNIPFAKIDLAVLFDEDLSSRDKVLYAILCSLPYKMESTHKSCQATISYLSTLLHRSERTVQNSLTALCARGVIWRISQFKDVELDGQMIRRQIESKFLIFGCHSKMYPDTAREGYYFTQIPPDIILNQNLPMTAKWLYMVIRSMTNMDSICTYLRTLANKMGVAISTVKKNLRILCEEKIIGVSNNFVGQTTQGKSASSYVLAPSSVDKFNVDIVDNMDNYGCECEKKAYLVSNSAPQINNISYFTKNTTKAMANINTKDGKGQFPISIKRAKRLTLNKALPLIPLAMQEVAKFILTLTQRESLYESEIPALVSLNTCHTPRRIKEEICRIADRFIKMNKDLKNLTLCYVWKALKQQPATFGNRGGVSKVSAEHAKGVITAERTDEQQRRIKVLTAKYAKPQSKMPQTAEKLNWTNLVPKAEMSETEAQTTIANAENQSISQETERLAQAITAKKQQKEQPTPSKGAPAPVSFTVPVLQDSATTVTKEQVMEFLNETLASELQENATTAEKVLENTAKGINLEEVQAKLKQIWDVKIQANACTNCTCGNIEQCPYHGIKHGLFISHSYGSTAPILFFSREKCDTLLKTEIQAKEIQTQKLFAEAVRKSGIDPIHTFGNYKTDDSLELLNAKAAAMKSAKDGSWLLFCGSVGCGKTFLSQAIGLSVIAHNIKKGLNPFIPSNSVIFTTAKQMLNRLWEDFRTYDARIAEYKNCKVLIIDEVGRENNSPRASKDLFEILNARYAKGLQTIFTSNLTLEQLVRHNPDLYKPILSRLSERGAYCDLFSVRDYRAACASADAETVGRREAPQGTTPIICACA